MPRAEGLAGSVEASGMVAGRKMSARVRGCRITLATPLVALFAAGASAQSVPRLLVVRGDETDALTHVRAFDQDLQESVGMATVLYGKGTVTATGSPSLGQWLSTYGTSTGGIKVLDAGGAWSPHPGLPHAAYALAATRDGTVLAAGYSTLSAVGPDGAVSWSVPGIPAVYYQSLAVTPGGHAWLAAGTGLSALLWRVEIATGTLLEETWLAQGDGWFTWYTATDARSWPDGSVWVAQSTPGVEPYLYFGAKVRRSSGGAVLQEVPAGTAGYMSPFNHRFEVDGAGRILTVDVSYSWCWCAPETLLVASDPDTPELPEVLHDFGRDVHGIRLGPTGRDLFAIVEDDPYTSERRLARLNLSTGARSTVPLGGPASGYATWGFPAGDTTGWTWAFSVDPAGDPDGDGAPNRAETGAGSDPYDPDSRPDGPQVGLWFPSDDSLTITLHDPDGVRHPAKGLDLATFVVLADGDTDVAPLLQPYFVDAQPSPDGRTLTFSWAGLPPLTDSKVRVEARVTDRTGAVGRDWQVTPPGDL